MDIRKMDAQTFREGYKAAKLKGLSLRQLYNRRKKRLARISRLRELDAPLVIMKNEERILDALESAISDRGGFV